MVDIKPIFLFFIYIALTYVIVKITVADLIATFMADVGCYYLIISKVVDLIAIILCGRW